MYKEIQAFSQSILSKKQEEVMIFLVDFKFLL